MREGDKCTNGMKEKRSGGEGTTKSQRRSRKKVEKEMAMKGKAIPVTGRGGP
jgi:hypothetical protein